MNWDAIGAVGEILGAAAVLVTRVYSAIQLRPTDREGRASSVRPSTAPLTWAQRLKPVFEIDITLCPLCGG